VELAKSAANKGSPYGQLVWGSALRYEHGGEKEDKTAGNELLSLARSGLEELVGLGLRSPTDVCALAGAYAQMHGKELAAETLLAEAVEEGHAIAHIALAKLDPDNPMAIGLLRAAAGKGLASAQSELGARYLSGRGLGKHDKGMEKDERRAAKLFGLAAGQGRADAQCELGISFWAGRGVDKDDEQAGNVL
jgi:TPR repeat protein